LAKSKTTVAFKGTARQAEQLEAVIGQFRDMPGALMPVMQKAQEIYGYLPLEVQEMIAKGLNIPVTDVYGVATFYAQFTLNPRGKYTVSVCLGTACYVRGAQDILDAVCEKLSIQTGECTPDGKFSVEACRCIGACGLSPVMMVNDEVYGRLTKDQVGGILDKYIEKD
jgi:NADH-quinone oxidoreductase E subunit